MSKFLLIDMRTGLMDGLYATRESCLEAIETLEERYETSFWRIFEMIEDGREFGGTFPPDHLFHHFVEQAIKEQDRKGGVH
jgi:hypothetical protein